MALLTATLPAFAQLSAQDQATMPQAPPSDVTEATFVRELIPALLGRRPYGVAEINLVAEISRNLGRDKAALMLMQQPEFVAHWTDLVLDILEVQRGGIRSQDKACFANPLRAADDGGALAAFVRDAPPDAAVATPFNMIDLIRSAIELDDLSPVYQAYLFVLTARRDGLDDVSGNAYAADEFMRVYLNRDFGCLRCHNRSFSMSNKQDNAGNVTWRRLWSIPAHVEKALFGNYSDVVGAEERLRMVLRGGVRSTYSGVQPWQIQVECTSHGKGPYRKYGRFDRSLGGPVPNAIFASADGAVDPRANVLDVERAFRRGVNALATDGLVRTEPSVSSSATPFCNLVDLTSDTCTGCHLPPDRPGNLDFTGNPAQALADSPNTQLVVPFDSQASVLYQRLAAGGMPPGSTNLSPEDVALVGLWIDAGASNGDPASCSPSHIPEVEPDPAFAFQVAVTAVDRVWQQVMGQRLTIDHGFARNEAQLQILWHLTENVFIPESWSLTKLLTEIVTSDYFVRRSPADGGAGPYPLPMVIDPWIEADPTLPAPNDPLGARYHNGPGELVHRSPGNELVKATATAMAWRQPERFPLYSGAQWPRALEQEMGRYTSSFVPGHSEVDFQSLLHWESEIGVCTKVGRTDTMDWVDRVTTEILSFNQAGPSAPISYEEAYLVVKDWLVQDPTVSSQLPSEIAAGSNPQSERQALLAFLNNELPSGSVVSLGDGADSQGGVFLETKLRELCGVLLKSPTFMLSHTAPASYASGLPAAPRVRVCNQSPCTSDDMCMNFRVNLATLGEAAYCESGEISFTPPPQVVVIPDQTPTDPLSKPPGRTSVSDRAAYEQAIGERARALAALCPDNRCAFLPWNSAPVCETKPAACRQPPVPACDPRCTGSKCCGGLPADARTQGVLSVWVEGAVVERAESVLLFQPSSRGWAPAKKGTRLQPGDVLMVPRDAEFSAVDKLGRFGTPSLVAPTKPSALIVPLRKDATAITTIRTRPAAEATPVAENIPVDKARAVTKIASQPTVALVRKDTSVNTVRVLTPTGIRTRGVLPTALDEVQRPLILSITGPTAVAISKITSRGAKRVIAPSILRAPGNKEFFQGRALGLEQQRRIARSVARPPAKQEIRAAPEGLQMHEAPSPPRVEQEVRPTIDLQIRFRKGSVQSVFCPGVQAARCTPDCELSLPAPDTCSVLGSLSGTKLSGDLKAFSTGSLFCEWRRGQMVCRAITPRRRR